MIALLRQEQMRNMLRYSRTCEMVLRCVLGEREELIVDVSQGSALSHCVFAVVIDVIKGK